MSITDIESVPRPLGFVLARRDVRIPWWETRGYRGVDRLPFVPSPLKPQPDAAAQVWDEYLSAWEDGTITKDYDAAEYFQHQLATVGQLTEIIYGTIEVGPEAGTELQFSLDRERSLAWLRVRYERVGAPPADFAKIGLDIASPLPSFHSVVVQPELVEHDKSFRDHMNDSGLIDDDLDYATTIMRLANQSGYLLSTFCVIGIFASP